MAGSVANILTEINQWDLTRVDVGSPSIFNGCVLKVVLEQKTLVLARKELEGHLGYEIDDSLFRSHTAPLRKRYDSLKRRVQNVKVWEDFKELLGCSYVFLPSVIVSLFQPDTEKLWC